MNYKNFIICTLYLLLASGGIVLMKLGSKVSKSIVRISFLDVAYSWVSCAGVICYGFSFIIFTIIISRMNISQTYNILAGIAMCITTILGIVIFKESLTLVQVVGLSMIIIGALLLGIRR